MRLPCDFERPEFEVDQCESVAAKDCIEMLGQDRSCDGDLSQWSKGAGKRDGCLKIIGFGVGINVLSPVVAAHWENVERFQLRKGASPAYELKRGCGNSVAGLVGSLMISPSQAQVTQ